MNVLASLTACFWQVGCSSAGKMEVLETIEPSELRPTAQDPAYLELMQRLKELGYEGVGLEHESAAIHELMLEVFSDNVTANRQIKYIYTGIHMGYESKVQSLTIGGTDNIEAIKSYIKKNVPPK